MSHLMTKPTKWVCAQRRLRSAWASTQSDQSSLCTQWVAKDLRFLHADSEDWSDWADAGWFCHVSTFFFHIHGVIWLYSLSSLLVHSTQTQWDNPFMHSRKWVSVRFGIHISHSHSSDPQKLSECWVKSTPPSSPTHFFGLFIRWKFCFKKW